MYLNEVKLQNIPHHPSCSQIPQDESSPPKRSKVFLLSFSSVIFLKPKNQVLHNLDKLFRCEKRCEIRQTDMTWVCQDHIGDVLCYLSSHHHGFSGKLGSFNSPRWLFFHLYILYRGIFCFHDGRKGSSIISSLVNFGGETLELK